MKTFLMPTMLATALALPCLAVAQPVTLEASLVDYKGNGAYMAMYLTDAKGGYQRTLWVVGKKPKYYKHLRDWARGSALRSQEYDGKTGATIRGGNTLTATADIPEAMIDAGYQIRIDSAVEDQKEHRAEVVVPLTRAGAGQSVTGQGYVKSFTYSF